MYIVETGQNSSFVPALSHVPFVDHSPLILRVIVINISLSPRCKVHTLLVEYAERNFTPHHYPLHAEHLPNMSQCLQLLEDIYTCLQSGRKTAIQ